MSLKFRDVSPNMIINDTSSVPNSSRCLTYTFPLYAFAIWKFSSTRTNHGMTLEGIWPVTVLNANSQQPAKQLTIMKWEV